MSTDCINYQDSGYFTKLMVDYLNQSPELSPLYNRFPKLENFKDQLLEKGANFSMEHRNVLVSALNKQYQDTALSESTQHNINSLKSENTFTITTGHQLNLFTGPGYFLYKIFSVINLSEKLNKTHTDKHFVPVYWMATEDHDFDEINHFSFRDKIISWPKNASGPVGRLDTQGLDEVFKMFEKEIGVGKKAEEIKNLFVEGYLKHDNLTAATRHIANALFSSYGLVIIDGDDRDLKKLFAPIVKKELLEEFSQKNVLTSIQLLKDYHVQVNPRELNLFYIQDGLRERIVKEAGVFQVLHTELKFTEEEILKVLEATPEVFSPNVILRPVYQECILPNLCYVGGGGELAYWLELKNNFDALNITFPMLLLRDSVLLVTAKQANKIKKLNLSYSDLFLKQDVLIGQQTKFLADQSLDFKLLENQLKLQFETLKAKVEQTDASFKNALDAQETKQLKGLNNLEKRWYKAEGKRNEEALNRIKRLQYELFPNGSLQERKQNFASFYIDSEQDLLQILKDNLDPLEAKFKIVEI